MKAHETQDVAAALNSLREQMADLSARFSAIEAALREGQATQVEIAARAAHSARVAQLRKLPKPGRAIYDANMALHNALEHAANIRQGAA